MGALALALSVGLASLPVDQGAPGNQGAWSMKVVGPVYCVGTDGGSSGGASVVTVDGGALAVTNLPAVQVAIIDSGTVDARITNLPASQAVTGTFWPTTQVVLVDAGTIDARLTNLPGNLLTDGGVVNVGNFPASQAVTGTFWPPNVLTDGGVINVGNFPTTQTVSGTVTANQGGAWSSTVTQATGSNLHVAVDSAPTTAVTGTFWPNLQVALIDSGTVDARITNLPGNLLTDGGVVNVGNFPASQAVAGTFWPPNLLADGGVVNVGNFPATQAVSGTVAATQSGSWSSTVTQATGTNLHAVIDSAPTTAVTQSGTWTVQPGNTANTTAWKIDGSAVTQPVSGTVTANAGTGSFTVAQATGTNLHTVVDSAPTTSVSQSGTWTVQPGNTANTTAWKVDGSAVTQPVSGTITANAGSGSFTVAQATGTNLHTVVDSAPTTAVTQSGTWNVTNVSGTVSLPTGASTAANQTTLGSQTTKLNDGTNTSAVKAASTAPATTDTALVVTQSPNGGNPCQNPTATLVGISGSTSGTTAVQLVALSGSTKIYICSMNITGVSGTTPTFSLVTGTGSNCASTQAVLVGAWTTTANTVYPFSGTVAVGPAGAALCYLDTGTTPIQRYTLTYVQE